MTSSHRLIERWAEQDPSRLALLCGEERLSYDELNVRANQLARHLRAQGGGPEVLVGLCVDRSIDIAVGVLAILKTGSGWLPLDPAYPAERLRFVLEHARPELLVGPASRLANMPATGARAVFLDSNSAEIASQPAANLEQDATPESMAYVIYTSGSTGRPKGVVITHGNLSHYVEAMAEATGVGASARYLHTASISFSSSVRQLMLPLTQGAAVAVATREQVRDPLELFAEIRRNRVTVIDLVPSYWRSAIRALASLSVSRRKELLANALDSILLTGEPLFSDLPETWTFEFEHPARLINMFGQTETTGSVATYEIPKLRQSRARIVPIGRPIRDTSIVLLDEHSRPAPAGAPGELAVGGRGVGRGYLHDPARTAERFVENSIAGGRLYRTGDFAVSRPDGTLEFLGRLDHQVKIRGYRIELGEIETVLKEHPGVRDAVVTAEGGIEKRLFAYFVPASAEVPLASDLRRHLARTLPDFMIPAGFLPLDAMPLTPSGKVDRASLQAPAGRRPGVAPFVPPRTEVEKALAKVWKEVLKIDCVGVEDNFFEQGGHSLLATVLVNRIAQSFNVQIPLRRIFEEPLKDLAITIAEDLAAGERPEGIFEILEEVRSLSDEEARLQLASEGHTDKDCPPTRS